LNVSRKGTWIPAPALRPACAGLVLGLLLFSLSAAAGEAAQPKDSTGVMRLLRAQGQYIVLGSLGSMGENFGGLEMQVNASALSFGLAAGLRFERVLLKSGTCSRLLQGGHLDVAVQWRPLQLLSPRLTYHMMDIHLDVGFITGGLRDGGESIFRSGIYMGGSLDWTVPIKAVSTKASKSELEAGMPAFLWSQLVFSVQYRRMLVQSPSDAEVHDLLLGIGIRGVI